MTTATEKQISFAKSLVAKLDRPIVITGKINAFNNMDGATRSRAQKKIVAAEIMEGFESINTRHASVRIDDLIALTKGA